MPDNPTPPLSEEEKQKAKEAALADYGQKIAEAKLKAAIATKSLQDLDNPASEKELAATREAIAQSNQKALQSDKDAWKGPEIKALDGKITSEGIFIESRMLTSATLQKAFGKLAGKIGGALQDQASPLAFVIYHAPDFAALDLYRNIDGQLDVMKNNFKNSLAAAENILTIHPTGRPVGGVAPLVIGYAIAGVLRTAADIISLFRQNINYNNIDLPIEDMTLIAAFSQAMLKEHKDLKIFYPSTYPIQAVIPGDGATNVFTTKLQELRILNNSVIAHLEQIDAKLPDMDVQLAAATQDIEKQQLTQKITAWNSAKEILQPLPPSLAQLEIMLSTPDPVTALTALAVILRAERTVTLLERPQVYTIKLAAISKGSNKITESLFRQTKIQHSGGTELSCLIFRSDGSIVFADNTSSYIPYKEAFEISGAG